MFRKFSIFLSLTLLLFCITPLFSQKKEKVRANSAKSTYKWKIKKLIMEYAQNRQPEIRQGKKILRANTLIYDEKQEMGYAYQNVYFYDPDQKMTLTSGEGTYNSKKREVTASQNPVLKLEKENLTTHSRIVKIYPDSKIIHLIGEVVIQTKDRTIRGSEATYFQKSGRFDVKGKAFSSDQNQTISGDQIHIISPNNKVTGYTASGHVRVNNKKKQTEIFADQINYQKKDESTLASGNVRIEDKKNKTTLYADRITQIKNQPSVAVGHVRIEDHKKHTILTADSIENNSKIDQSIAIGNVEVTDLDEKTFLSADQLISDHSNKKTIATGSIRLENHKDKTIITCGKLEDFGKKNYSRLTENPKIEFKDKNIFAYSTVMENDKKTKKAHLLGNVIIIQGKKRSYSRWGIYDSKSKIMELTGNPILVDGDSRFSGNKIIVDVDKDTMRMVGSGSGFFKYKGK